MHTVLQSCMDIIPGETDEEEEVLPDDDDNSSVPAPPVSSPGLLDKLMAAKQKLEQEKEALEAKSGVRTQLPPLKLGNLKAGTFVTINGLVNKAELNGEMGVIDAYDAEKGRYKVSLVSSSHSFKLKPDNLQVNSGTGNSTSSATQAKQAPAQSAPTLEEPLGDMSLEQAKANYVKILMRSGEANVKAWLAIKQKREADGAKVLIIYIYVADVCTSFDRPASVFELLLPPGHLAVYREG